MKIVEVAWVNTDIYLFHALRPPLIPTFKILNIFGAKASYNGDPYLHSLENQQRVHLKLEASKYRLQLQWKRIMKILYFDKMVKGSVYACVDTFSKVYFGNVYISLWRLHDVVKVEGRFGVLYFSNGYIEWHFSKHNDNVK